MTLQLPTPGPEYSAREAAETRSALEREDLQNQKKNQDIVIERRRLILISPDSSRFELTVTDLGILVAVPL